MVMLCREVVVIMLRAACEAGQGFFRCAGADHNEQIGGCKLSN